MDTQKTTEKIQNSKNNDTDLGELLTMFYFIVMNLKKLCKATLNKMIYIKCFVHA